MRLLVRPGLGRDLGPSLLAFLAAFVTLFVQILVYRMVSAKLLNNFAFLVISLTMLGFAGSGVLLTRHRRLLLARRQEAFAACAAVFGLTLVVGSALFYRAPAVEPLGSSRAGFLAAFLSCVPLALLFALPFAASGLILGLLLSAPDLRTRRIYFFDLIGSATGAWAVILAISHLGVERSSVVASALLVAGTLSRAAWRQRTLRGLTIAAVLALAVTAARPEAVFRMRYPEQSFLGLTEQAGSGYALEHVAWDPVARIEVSRVPPPDPATFTWPCLIGSDRDFLSRFSLVLTQNNNAFTYGVDYDGRLESLRGVEETIYAAAYRAALRPPGSVLIVGVGGGFDVLTALRFGAARITGVEINGATLGILTRTYRPYFRAWVEDPRVRLVHDDGRHFLARSTERYDVIQLSGVDSASGTPAAAHVFSESYLYTAEAFDLYLSRLSEDGILNVMRPEYVPPREMLRTLTTAVAALRRSGVGNPAEHVSFLAARNGLFAALLAKRAPFRPQERARLAEWAERSPSFMLAAPAPAGAPPANAYQAFLSLGDARKEAAFAYAYPFDVRPVDDDRPFFFNYSYWGHLLSSHPLLQSSVPVMEYSLLVLFVLTALAAAACVYVPLRVLAAAGLRVPGASRHALFFACLGLGYMAVEIALLQKFGLFLGHPNYALSVVLASLLVATGLGSLFSDALASALGGLRFVAYALATVLLAEHLIVFPRLPALVALDFPLRVMLVAVLVLPIGLCLGVFFPSGLDRLKSGAPAFVPWAWAVNGIFSVVSPVLSVAVSLTWGISALLLAAIPVYLLAGFAAPSPAAGVSDVALAESG